jgi:predicted negative regulator of RcsB-dependent stress response
MNEDITTTNTNVNSEKIKSFFNKNKKKFFILLSIIFIMIISYFAYGEIKKRNKIKIANQFNIAKMKFISGNRLNIKNEMKKIIELKDQTYSPLALYFLIDNEMLKSKEEANKFFDLIIKETNINKEIKNLVIYKKALYNADHATENSLLKILNPVINSESIWKSHALLLLGEYFLSKNEKQKSREFFERIIKLEDSNIKIKLEAEKRIQSDFN